MAFSPSDTLEMAAKSSLLKLSKMQLADLMVAVVKRDKEALTDSDLAPTSFMVFWLLTELEMTARAQVRDELVQAAAAQADEIAQAEATDEVAEEEALEAEGLI